MPLRYLTRTYGSTTVPHRERRHDAHRGGGHDDRHADSAHDSHDRHGLNDLLGLGRSGHGLHHGVHDGTYGRLLFGSEGHHVSFFTPHYGHYNYSRPYSHYLHRRHHRDHHDYGAYSYGLGFGLTGLGYYPNAYYSGFGYPTRSYSETIIYQDVYPPDPQGSDVYYSDPTVQGGAGYGSVTLAQPGTAAAPTDAGVTGNVAGVADPTLTEPTLVDLGNVAFNAGDYEEAMRFYITALLTDDQDAVARLFYGLSQFAVGDYSMASMAMRRALAVDPTLIEQPIDLRSLYPDLETFVKQLSSLESYVAKHPDNVHALFLMGYVYFAAAEPEKAIETLKQLTTIEPQHDPGAYVLGVAKAIVTAEAEPKTPQP